MPAGVEPCPCSTLYSPTLYNSSTLYSSDLQHVQLQTEGTPCYTATRCSLCLACPQCWLYSALSLFCAPPLLQPHRPSVGCQVVRLCCTCHLCSSTQRLLHGCSRHCLLGAVRAAYRPAGTAPVQHLPGTCPLCFAASPRPALPLPHEEARSAAGMPSAAAASQAARLTRVLGSST